MSKRKMYAIINVTVTREVVFLGDDSLSTEELEKIAIGAIEEVIGMDDDDVFEVAEMDWSR